MTDQEFFDQPLGTVQQVLAGGPDHLYGQTPIYGARYRYLPAIKQIVLQVKIKCYGDMAWINVNPRDVRLNMPQDETPL